MRRLAGIAVVVAGVLVIGGWWVAVAWEGILVGLVLLLHAVAAVASAARRRGIPLAEHLDLGARGGAAYGVSLGARPGVHETADPPVPGGVAVAARRLIREVEAFLAGQSSGGRSRPPAPPT